MAIKAVHAWNKRVVITHLRTPVTFERIIDVHEFKE